MEEKDNSNRQTRLLLALFLSMGVWFFINYTFFPPQETNKVSVSSNKSSQNETEKLTLDNESELQILNSEIEDKDLSIAEPKVMIEKSQFYLVTDPFIVQFTNVGGRMEKFYLKDHKNVEGEDVWVVRDSIAKVSVQNQDYNALEITRSSGFDFNFLTSRSNPKISKINRTLFEQTIDRDKLLVQFKTKLPQNKDITLVKTYQFFKKENYFKFYLKLINTSDKKIVLADNERNLYFRSFGSIGRYRKVDAGSLDFSRYFRFYYSDDSFEDFIDSTSSSNFVSRMFGGGSTETFSTFGEGESIDFLGSGSRYFVSVLNPLNKKPKIISLDNRENNTTGVLINYNDIQVDANSEYNLDYAAYVGIREVSATSFHDENLNPFENSDSIFRGLSSEMEQSFNQGITTPFRNGIVWILKKLYIVIPNYGWCIIVFSILFKLSFYPLNQKQAKSMKKMQELSPELKKINEKYKDPKKRQEKTLEIYKKHKVNPMSGCLPIVIQIPIFIALYTAFSDTIELWRSSFLWVNDLSEPDTVFKTAPFLFFSTGFAFNILPIIMTATQFVQTKMTAVTTDPNQKMIMSVMPIIMLYFFWSMPSGVTLYWTIQNILSIIQQYITNKTKDNDNARLSLKKDK